MSRIAGYILVLRDSRYFSFNINMHYKFAEPVPEFTHPRHIPLVCFITNESGYITHVGLGKRGQYAGTDLRRLNIEDIFELAKPVSVKEIVNLICTKLRHHIIDKVHNGGFIPNRSFEEFLCIFLKMAPESIPVLDKYGQSRQLRIKRLTRSVKESLAQQKEAVLTAMNIAGIDKENAQGWDYKETGKPLSFLDGIDHINLREDSIIINDLNNMPGFELIRSTKHSASIFENEKTRLTVLLANRLPLEELTGTDLIYFNEDFKCFIMVQYKVMEKEGDKFIFRLPNSQLSEEIARMDSILNLLKLTEENKVINDYRISQKPFFIKICPRLEFDPDNVGLSKGMYIPLDYIKILQSDKCIEGKRGGKGITYNNIGRYFDNTAFKAVVEGGWIGTNQSQSLLLEEIIKNILQNGKTAVLAIKKRLEIDFENKSEE